MDYSQRGKLNRLHELSLERCGFCDNWMKKSSCPMERTRKPNCNDGCDSFVRSNYYQAFINELCKDLKLE